jgi:AcrR family transcriptional regulator
VPRDATETKRKLLDAAARTFAEAGVRNASMIEITRRAGQRNSGALHYHFGSREGVLCAVLVEHVDFLARREGELLEAARERSDDDVAAVVEAVVRPAAELAGSGWRGRSFLLILADLVEEDPATFGPELNEVLARTGGEAVYEELTRRLPALRPDVLVERLSLMTMFILRAVADRARVHELAQAASGAEGRDGRGRRGRAQLDDEAFVQNLVAMVSAAVAAPDRVGGTTRRRTARSR